jgi:hypothetical protein
MSDTASATPVAPSTPAQAATQQIMDTLPADQKVKKSTDTSVQASEEIEDTGEDLPADDNTPAVESKKKAEAAAKKAYKLKVGGKDLEVDESELLKRAQMGYSADQKWQEAAQMRKQMDSFIHLLQTDPAKALEQMGYDVDKMAEERIKYRIEEMQKSPEQIEREKMQRELESMKAERERERTEVQQRETQRIQDQYAIEIENDISAALDDSSAGFPKTPYVVKRVADMMILAIQEGIRTNNDSLKRVTAKDILPIVREEIRREQRELYDLSSDEDFEQLVGKDRLNKYRKSKLKKTATKPTSATDVKPTGTKELQKAQDEANSKQKKQSAKDFFKKLGSR